MNIQPFLEAIRNSPEDDNLRLFLCDYLDDHGKGYELPGQPWNHPFTTDEMRLMIEKPETAWVSDCVMQFMVPRDWRTRSLLMDSEDIIPRDLINNDRVEHKARVCVHRGLASAIIGSPEAIVAIGPIIAEIGCLSVVEADPEWPVGVENYRDRTLDWVVSGKVITSIQERRLVEARSIDSSTRLVARELDRQVLSFLHNGNPPNWKDPVEGEWRVVRCDRCGHIMPSKMCSLDTGLRSLGHPVKTFCRWHCAECQKPRGIHGIESFIRNSLPPYSHPDPGSLLSYHDDPPPISASMMAEIEERNQRFRNDLQAQMEEVFWPDTGIRYTPDIGKQIEEQWAAIANGPPPEVPDPPEDEDDDW